MNVCAHKICVFFKHCVDHESASHNQSILFLGLGWTPAVQQLSHPLCHIFLLSVSLCVPLSGPLHQPISLCTLVPLSIHQILEQHPQSGFIRRVVSVDTEWSSHTSGLCAVDVCGCFRGCEEKGISDRSSLSSWPRSTLAVTCRGVACQWKIHQE